MDGCWVLSTGSIKDQNGEELLRVFVPSSPHPLTGIVFIVKPSQTLDCGWRWKKLSRWLFPSASYHLTESKKYPKFMPYLGRYWNKIDDGRLQCHLCPRCARLSEGQRGFCFVRQNISGQMVLTTYGRSSGFCLDPVEKKPLNHFLPGTATLSFGTAGCNLGCKFCQNWDISKSKAFDRLTEEASPQDIAQAAHRLNVKSIAFTYNDPVIFAEYAIDTAIECHKLGVKTIAVTAGYITPQARGEFFAHMDAANVDLKGFYGRFLS